MDDRATSGADNRLVATCRLWAALPDDLHRVLNSMAREPTPTAAIIKDSFRAVQQALSRVVDVDGRWIQMRYAREMRISDITLCTLQGKQPIFERWVPYIAKSQYSAMESQSRGGIL